jgi:hypothetical protein
MLLAVETAGARLSIREAVGRTVDYLRDNLWVCERR